MTTIRPLVYRLAAGEVEKLIIDGLRVKYEVFLQEPAELTFTLVDSDGRDVMELVRVRVCSGDSVTLTGIERALTVVVGS